VSLGEWFGHDPRDPPFDPNRQRARLGEDHALFEASRDRVRRKILHERVETEPCPQEGDFFLVHDDVVVEREAIVGEQRRQPGIVPGLIITSRRPLGQVRA
jgi:hypothetical protein